MKLFRVIAFTLSVATFAGCASTKSSKTWSATGDPVVDGRSVISHGPPKDRVLWQYRTALAALRRGQYGEAKSLLDDALLTIGGIQGKDKEAKRSRGYFSEESRKTFRGEPYERVMAYYYRGILYWMDGEPDNARACFRSAQLQDSDTENKDYSSDYVLLDYLDGLATAKLAGDGSDALKRAQAVSKAGTLPACNAKANALFFLEFGTGPTKYATGEYDEQLRFRAGQSVVRSARIKIGDQTISVGPCDDLNFQATTRGGRVMDHVLANKAVFKTTTDTLGNAALLTGAVVASNRNTQEAGLGLLAFGLVSKIVSAATTPSADTRSWNGLPQFLSFTAAELPPGSHTATVEFLDARGQVLSTLTKTANINVASTRDTVVFVSDQSHTSKP
ncbi:MAG: hypothetical protein FJ403_08305 [Verrucomicrobia bacterium]|nr:hypothetical protein [Verrucomicrobiota bacterium]